MTVGHMGNSHHDFEDPEVEHKIWAFHSKETQKLQEALHDICTIANGHINGTTEQNSNELLRLRSEFYHKFATNWTEQQEP